MFADTKGVSSTPTNTRAAIKKDVILNFIGNLVGGAGGAWLLFGAMTSIAPHGIKGFIADLSLTGFALPLLLGSILIYIYRRKHVDEALCAIYQNDYIARRLPKNRAVAIVAISIFGLLSTSLLISLPLYILYPDGVPPLIYAAVKGLWLGLISAIAVLLATRIASLDSKQPAPEAD
ncbi:hypothetical protein [Zhongshania sp.]|uniref:hypothetical protein n=1 Tax=Zhongshania sp. TaxID=1971902 RepID=UPI00356362E7